MEGLEYLRDLYKKAYESGDARLCEHIMDALAKVGVTLKEDKLDVLNKMKKGTPR